MKVPCNFRLPRELLQQLDLVVAERTRSAIEATGSHPRLTRTDVVEEACWRVVLEQLQKPAPAPKKKNTNPPTPQR